MYTQKLQYRCLVLLLLLCFYNNTNAQIQRVEPMNWWVGMQNSTVQLLVQAPNVADYQVSLNYPGVNITSVTQADSKNYLFINLFISKVAQAGTMNIEFKQGKSVVMSHAYPLLARTRTPESYQGFTSKDAIYLVTPDRFANGDPSNDIDTTMREKSINRKEDYARHGGDIRGMINHLDYIADMGFTALWPTPVLENNMVVESYHGYAITDFYKVDSRFGTLADYKELADKARSKGIKLIFDNVVNHSGLYYWWMGDLPFKNWIHYPDSFQVTSHLRTTHQDPYAADVDKETMTSGWFVSTMPDLNTEHPMMATYMIQNSIWWIETLGLGGIRQDTYPYSTDDFLSKWSCSIMREYPNFSIVGEEWSVNPLVAAYWQQSKTNSKTNKSCLKSTMDFPLQKWLVESLTDETERWDKGFIKVYEALSNDVAYESPQDLMILGDNHDMNRLFTQVKEDTVLMQMALTYLLTMRGIPQLYYGTEVLMQNTAKPNDHGLIRSEFAGGWESDAVNNFTGKGLTNSQLAMQSYLKKLLNWRKNNAVIHNGKIKHFGPEQQTYCYFRYNDNKTVMVILNKNDKMVQLNAKRFAEILKPFSKGTNIITGEQQDITQQIKIAPRSALVLELSK